MACRHSSSRIAAVDSGVGLKKNKTVQSLKVLNALREQGGGATDVDDGSGDKICSTSSYRTIFLVTTSINVVEDSERNLGGGLAVPEDAGTYK